MEGEEEDDEEDEDGLNKSQASILTGRPMSGKEARQQRLTLSQPLSEKRNSLFSSGLQGSGLVSRALSLWRQIGGTMCLRHIWFSLNICNDQVLWADGEDGTDGSDHWTNSKQA